MKLLINRKQILTLYVNLWEIGGISIKNIDKSGFFSYNAKRD